MKILCATDLTAASDAAIDRAYQLRESLNARLTLLHVVPTLDADIGTLEQRLLAASSRLAHRARHAGTGIELVVRCGRPASVISAEAKDAHLVVVGAHRRGASLETLRDHLIGRLAAQARRPLLVVRRAVDAPYRRVMLALDGSAWSGQVVRVVETFWPAAAERAVVHAHEPAYEAMMNTVGVGNLSVANYASASMSQAADLIHAALRRHSSDPRRYRVLLVDARPAGAILRASQEFQPDLLALGTRGYGPLRRALLGSTAHEVLRDSEGDVLLAPEIARGLTPPMRGDAGPAAA